MFKHRSLIVMASATICFSAATMPSSALDLSKTVSTVTSTVDSAVGTVQGTVDPVATASVGALTPKAAVALNAKSSLIGGISVQLKLLSTDELAKLCVKAGGGTNSCGSGDRSQLIGLITARLGVLGPNQLASLCVSVGGSCGGSPAPAGGGGGGGGDNSLSNLSTHDRIIYKKNCGAILRSPDEYDDKLVRLCRLASK